MDKEQLERAFEEEYLKETLSEAERQLEQSRNGLERKRSEMLRVKKDIFENTGQSIGNLSNPEDFDALVELSQGVTQIDEIVSDYEEIRRKIVRLESLIGTPYFARIDFLFEGDDIPEKIYIGRTSLKTDNSLKIYVYDWRSPIAGVFYRFVTGPAYYDAPGGQIGGELQRKRQYEIKNGRLVYFFDTDMNISDEILKQMLSRNASPAMKAIVETIQKEQDIVIRNMENDLLMIQGVAGSGKTSIALHRAAYLMYEGLKNRLTANNILILSPNEAFEEYIANVLPELGEENVTSMVFEDILHAVLKEKPAESCAAFLEEALSDTAAGRLRKMSMRFKTSPAFLRILNRFADEIPLYWMDFKAVYLGGQCLITGEELKNRVLRNPGLPLAARIRQQATRVWEEAWGGRRDVDKDAQNAAFEELQNLLRLDVYRFYRILWEQALYFQDVDAWEGEERGGFTKAEIEEIREATLEHLDADRLCYEDAAAVLWLYLKLYGNRDYRHIRQVIIDEAQDYEPLQYEIFRMLFPDAKYTVCGDVNQTLAKQEDASFYERVRNILNKKSSSLVALNKSFRCTNEILRFSLRFIDQDPGIASFNRSGDPVNVMAFAEKEAYLERIAEEIGVCLEKGYESVCLLCKNEQECGALLADLEPRMNGTPIRRSAARALSGVLLLPSYMAKGLEFDAVIVCGADSGNYRTADDKKLLYVECTRALHRLSVFCEGEMTAFAAECAD